MSVRLVNDWIPKHYGLDLSVSLADWNTFGTEVITLVAPPTRPTPTSDDDGAFRNTFTLHAGAAINILSISDGSYTIAANPSVTQSPSSATAASPATVERFPIGVKMVARCEAKQTVTFAFDEKVLPAGAASLQFTVRFQNPINPELRGLYRCTYKEEGVADENTTNTTNTTDPQDTSPANTAKPTARALVERRMASTHFEPIGARLMYLCVDEPAVRVAFSLTVRLPTDLANYTVLSNGPLESRTVNTNELESSPLLAAGEEEVASATMPPFTQTHFPYVVKFKQVEAIPTYLTCLVVGDLDFIEDANFQSKNDGDDSNNNACASFTSKTPIRFYAVKGKAHKAKFGLDVARFSLHYFEKFFQSTFPMPKLDLVAVPDFPIGGMENWGCICLSETCLMPYEKESDNSVAKLKSVCNLVTHEVSHNWFGNLVGIDWWDGLWLKEGFATWCGIQGTIAFRPQLREDHSFYGDMNEALTVDGFAGSHPIETRIDDPADITQVFDSISYDKGMAVCNMLQGYLGPERFSQGLAHYVKQYAYKNTTTAQLWRAIEEETKVLVVDVMESFTSQKGFPLISIAPVTATAATSIDYCTETQLHVSQEKFAYLGCPEHLPDAMWRVPLRIVIINKNNGQIVVDHRTVMAEKQCVVTIPAATPEAIAEAGVTDAAADLVLVTNPGGAGFFRVLYTAPIANDNGGKSASASSSSSPLLFTALLSAYPQLPELYRRSVLNDLVAVYMCGKLSLEEVVSLLSKAIDSEESFAIFHDALEGASFLQGTLANGGSLSSSSFTCGCGKAYHHNSDDAASEDKEAAAAASADAAGTIANALKAAVSFRCEKIAKALFQEGLATMAPETKMIRSYAMGNAISDRKTKLAAEVEKRTKDGDETACGQRLLKQWAKEDAVLSWACDRAAEFHGSGDDSANSSSAVAKYTITDPDTIAACLSIPLVTDPSSSASSSSSSSASFPEFEKLLTVYPHVEAAPEKAIAVLTALCSSGKDMEGLSQLLKRCTRNNGIRSMWGSVVVMALCKNKQFSALHLWSHWKSDWPAIFSQWGKSQFRIQRMIGALAHSCASLNTLEAAEDWKSFFASNPCPAARLDIERGYEMILLRSMLKDRDGNKFQSKKIMSLPT